MIFQDKSTLVPDFRVADSPSLIKSVKSAGFTDFARKLQNIHDARLEYLRNRFTEVTYQQSRALALDSKVTEVRFDKYDFGENVNRDMLASIAGSVNDAKGLSLKVWQIEKTSHTEWAVIGSKYINGVMRHFVVCRWGPVLEDLDDLIKRAHSREQKKIADREAKAALEAALARRAERRRVHKKRFFVLVRISAIVLGIAGVVFFFMNLPEPSTTPAPLAPYPQLSSSLSSLWVDTFRAVLGVTKVWVSALAGFLGLIMLVRTAFLMLTSAGWRVVFGGLRMTLTLFVLAALMPAMIEYATSVLLP